MKTINFLVTGVGGQGALLASNILADVGVRAGYDVKKSEVHGMAQRSTHLLIVRVDIIARTHRERGDAQVTHDGCPFGAQHPQVAQGLQLLQGQQIVRLSPTDKG